MTAPTHAGGVVFRSAGNEVEFLVVQARDNPTQWVFPKGHIEAGETVAETAGTTRPRFQTRSTRIGKGRLRIGSSSTATLVDTPDNGQ